MIKVSQDQAFQRWDTLPDKLKEALYSEAGSGFLWRTCESEHIPAEKIYGISAIVGYVLLGFLHPEDLGAEIKELGIAAPVAESVAKAVSGRVFAPLREEVNRVYEPPSGIGQRAGFPKTVEEIKPPAPVPAAPKTVGTTPPAAGRGELPGATTENPQAPLDISRIFGANRPTAEEKPPAVPPAVPPAAPKPAGAQVKQTPKDLLGEFERLGLRKEEVKNKESGGETEPPEAPAMLYKETEAKPAEKASGFKIEAPLSKFEKGRPLGGVGGWRSELPPRAVLEFGPGKRQSESSGEGGARVVNYSGLRTPLASGPKTPERKPPAPEPERGRSVTEITAETKVPAETAPNAKPGAPAPSPQPLKPPTPPAPKLPQSENLSGQARPRIEPPPIPPRPKI